MTKILKASLSELELLVPLFDQYRVFYEQESDIAAARTFLKARMERGESVIYLAMQGEKAVGFTQLYTTFSSVSMKPFYILNDLYVAQEVRGQGIGELLLHQAKTDCREMGYKGLSLETAVDNPAQKLYEKLGWEKDDHCFHYFWLSD